MGDQFRPSRFRLIQQRLIEPSRVTEQKVLNDIGRAQAKPAIVNRLEELEGVFRLPHIQSYDNCMVPKVVEECTQRCNFLVSHPLSKNGEGS